MTTTPQPDPNDPVTTDPPDTGSMADLKAVIRDVVTELLPKGRAAKADPEVDVQAQVRQAIADAKQADERTASEKVRDEKIAELQAKVDGREQAPRQFRKIEKFFGWVREEDGK